MKNVAFSSVKFYCYRVFIFCTLWCLYATAFGQNVRGIVKNAAGEPLPFTSILVKNTNQGTMANSDARFELKLPKGNYTLLFQHIGYQTLSLEVEVADKPVELQPVLTEQQIQLSEVVIGQSKEDPAYSIMRKAIAKAPIHRMMVKSYTAKVYIKGGGRLKDVPWLLRGALKKEGFDPDIKYFTESVSEISYRYPNFYKNKAISIRSNMEKFANPNSFINTSFYNEMVGSAISPLSPKAFSYYRFQYAGSFIDKGVEVNKIKVTPRIKGDDVFEGYLYIIDQLWSIHSLDLGYRHEGVNLRANQMYAPFNQVWMPVSNKYDINGKILGFDFELDYQANIDNYRLEVDETLVKPVEIIDPKAERSKIPDDDKTALKNENIKNALAANKPLTTKAVRKMMKAYAKEERKKQQSDTDAQALRIDSVEVDSSAYRMPDDYWESIRPIPLTEMEIKSTLKLDSLRKVDEEKGKKPTQDDEQETNAAKFLLVGHNFYFGMPDSVKKRPNRIRFEGLAARSDFNLLEGYAFETGLGYRRYLTRNTRQRRPYIQVAQHVRYGLARRQWMPYASVEYNYIRGRVSMEGGRYLSQLSGFESISPAVNSIYTFFFKRNYLRMYSKEYLRLDYEHTFAQRWYVNLYTEWAERSYMYRKLHNPLIRNDKREFLPDVDSNLYVGNMGFDKHRAHTVGLHSIYTPTVKYAVRNGKKNYFDTGLPYLHFKFRAGLPGLNGADAAFVASALGVEQRLALGARADVLYYLEAGRFFQNKKTYSPDFFHFAGNRTVFITADPLKSFRMLPYYFYSNTQQYAQAHVVFTPRLLLLNRIYWLDLMGWKESLSLRSLFLPGGLRWTEAGYALDGISRFLRVELTGSFINQQFNEVSVRLGITLKNRRPTLPRETADDENLLINIR